MKNVCIIGYGAIGPIHAAALQETQNARFYGVCDIDTARLKACREIYDVKCFTDFHEVMGDPQVDAVHICTPHYLHFDMIKCALEAGKMIVAEKPVTMTISELKELKKLPGAEKICFVLQNRYNPSIIALKEIQKNEQYGKLLAIRGVMTWNRTAQYYQSGAWRGKWATEGGGVLINQAVHTLDFMVYLGGAVSSVKANCMNYSLENVIEVEDTCTAFLKFKNDAGGMFFATNAYPVTTAPELEIVFEQKTLRYIDGKLVADGQVLVEDIKPSLGKACWGSGHKKLIKKFYDEHEFFALSDVENTMEAMFAIYESAALNGKEVKAQMTKE